MAFNKIQPEQIQLHTFFSRSGGFVFEQSDTGIRIDLARRISGSFDFYSGDLKNKGKPVFTMPKTGDNNFDFSADNVLLQGKNTDIGNSANDGSNFVIKGTNCSVSGQNNLIVNGIGVNFATDSQDNTSLAGRNITFQSTATGITVIKDSTTDAISYGKQNSLHIDFNGGQYFGDSGPTYFDNDINIDAAASGIFSGGLRVMGDSFIKGTAMFETGFSLPQWRGSNSTAGTAAIPATGAMAISGQKLLIQTGYKLWGEVGIGTLT
tara:strand:+ start:3504 stop:4298 length:795 start_codon:yes stop_codon:yes gene_type:complete